MNLSFIDLHSDTASELYYHRKHLDANDLHISLEKAACYQNYAQIFAVYTPSRLNDEEGFRAFLKVSDAFSEEISRLSDRIAFVSNENSLPTIWESHRAAAFLAVEDARLLAGNPDRLRTLYDRGVRFLTLTWAGETCIGGSWDTNIGLTDFGIQTVRNCFELGVIPDVSHASTQTIDNVIEIAAQYGNPFIATHSNSYAVYPHRRNLNDNHFKAICKVGGIVGMNMYRNHLSDSSVSPASIETVVSHIDHFMELGGEDTVVFGCDFDGADFPDDLADISAISKIADALLSKNYSEDLVEKIFWKNAYAFLEKNVFCQPEIK